MKKRLLNYFLEKATTKDFANVEKERRLFKRHVLIDVYRWPSNIIPYRIWTDQGKGSFSKFYYLQRTSIF